LRVFSCSTSPFRAPVVYFLLLLLISSSPVAAVAAAVYYSYSSAHSFPSLNSLSVVGFHLPALQISSSFANSSLLERYVGCCPCRFFKVVLLTELRVIEKSRKKYSGDEVPVGGSVVCETWGSSDQV